MLTIPTPHPAQATLMDIVPGARLMLTHGSDYRQPVEVQVFTIKERESVVPMYSHVISETGERHIVFHSDVIMGEVYRLDR